MVTTSRVMSVTQPNPLPGGSVSKAMLLGVSLVVLSTVGCASQKLTLEQQTQIARQHMNCPEGPMARADFDEGEFGYRGCGQSIEYELYMHNSSQRMRPLPRHLEFRGGTVPLSFLRTREASRMPDGEAPPAPRDDTDFVRYNNPVLLQIARHDLNCEDVGVVESAEGTATVRGCGIRLDYDLQKVGTTTRHRWVGVIR